VIGVAPLLRGSDVPDDLRGDVYSGEDDWMSRGGSAIVSPDGTLLAGPLHEREDILYAELDLTELALHRQQFDPVGHYARPDVFSLSVDVRPRRAVTFEDAPQHAAPSPG
jgi:nitrilase